MSHQDRPNLFGIAYTDSDRRMAEYLAFEQQREQLDVLARHVEQHSERNRLISYQNELLEQQVRMPASMGTVDPGVDDVHDSFDSASYQRAEEWEAEARYRNDPDYRAAYHAVLATADLDSPGFDARALFRHGYSIKQTYAAIKLYRKDQKYRRAYEWVMRKCGLGPSMEPANLVKHRVAIDSRRNSLRGRLLG